MSEQTFDVRDFRRALSQFPTGVTVITTLDADNQPVGVTASSFNSVSIDPALVLWSIDKGAFSLAAFDHAGHFAVNVLGRDQVDTSNRFASRGEDKFKDVQYSQGLGGCPLLENYAAQFECKTWAIYDGGDHLILVGEVKAYRYNDATSPLVFARGSYAVSSPHENMAKSNSTDTGAEGFVGDHLLYLLRETYNQYSSELYPKLMDECGVTPEEWRILAILSDKGSISVSELAPLVMQPDVALSQTADWMLNKGLIQYQGKNSMSLTEAGKTTADQLLAIARQQEADVLAKLPEEQAVLLKQSLKTILGH